MRLAPSAIRPRALGHASIQMKGLTPILAARQGAEQHKHGSGKNQHPSTRQQRIACRWHRAAIGIYVLV